MKVKLTFCFLVSFILINKEIYCQIQIHDETNLPHRIDRQPSLIYVIVTTDIFEIKYTYYKNLQEYIDTLPLYTNDETDGWRDVQLITYYYQTDSLKVISFRDGRRGYYYFFFEGSIIRKIRISDRNNMTNYYYSKAENDSNRSVHPQKLDRGIQYKCKQCLLNIGLTFKEKFLVHL